MRKQFLAVTIAVLLVLSVFAVLQFWQIKPVEATTIFSDGFESNDFTYWSGTGGAGTHSENVTATVKYDGSYSANLSIPNDGSTSWIYKDFIQQDQVNFMVWLNFSATPNSNWTLELTRLIDSDYSNYGSRAQIYNDNGTLKWQLYVKDDSANIHTDNSTTPTVTALEWCYVLLSVDSGSGSNGTVSLSVNGTEICTLDSLDMDLTGQPDRAMCYLYNYGVATSVYYDSVFIDNDVAPDTTAPVYSSITANSTLAGNDTQLSCTITDNVAISSYICSTNNTGPWVNATTIPCSGVAVIATWNSTWNETADNVVSAKIYANDSSDLWSVSSQYNFILTSTFILGDAEEIRGVFFHESIFAFTHNWTLIAETLATYKIDSVYGHFGNLDARRADAEWTSAIAAFHAKGIEFHACLAGPDTIHFNESWAWIDDAGNHYLYGNCPNNPSYLAAVQENVEEIATLYDIDGVMFDYARYETGGQCYCSYCKAAFEVYLNEPINASNWPPNGGDFIPTGARYNEFMEWRTIPITDLVRDVRNWMLVINPDLKFSLAAWTMFGDAPTYWRYYIGQDTAKWIAEGYLDMIAPMMYTADIPTIDLACQYNNQYFTGGPEGKIPWTAFLTTGISVPQFVDVVDEIRLKGTDGWIIWRYGGPGVDSGGYLVDITPYLGNITLPDACRNENITVSNIASTSATVTWDSTIDMTSVVEYSAEPFFSAYYLAGWGDFHYWDIDHTPNGTLISNSSKTASHTITITGLTVGVTYYYRVQSVGTGTVSSLVFNFTTNNAIVVTVTSPTNSTYAVASSISVSFTASGGTIDQYSFNAKNGSSWVYVSNQTGNSGTFTGFVVGTYTGYFWANNTEAVTGVATVTFTVSIIGGTASIIVNVWWGSFW